MSQNLLSAAVVIGALGLTIVMQEFFFSKFTYLKNSFRDTIRVLNSMDPNQAWHFVEPDIWVQTVCKG